MSYIVETDSNGLQHAESQKDVIEIFRGADPDETVRVFEAHEIPVTVTVGKPSMPALYATCGTKTAKTKPGKTTGTPRGKLTDDQVREAAKRRAQGTPVKQLAAQYQVTPVTMSRRLSKIATNGEARA